MRSTNARVTTVQVMLAISSAAIAAIQQTSFGQGGIIPFTEEALARGLCYSIQPWQSAQQYQGYGLAIVDLDGDGDNDLVMMGESGGKVGFFENAGGGRFIDRSMMLDGDGNLVPRLVLRKGSGVAAADYNGDGLIDLYFTQQYFQPNALMRNEGNFQFTDVSIEAGVDNQGFGESAAWGDYDNDGWLDLYLNNYTLPPDQNNPIRRNQLYRNRGDGTFESVGGALGVDDHGTSFGVAWSDIDRNGTLDLYVANDRGHLYRPNQLWRNNGGTFTNLCPQSSACLGLWSMSTAAGDFDGNGFPDFYITNLPNANGYGGINPLLLNNGNATFTEVSQLWGVDQFIFSWASIFFDYNNDGRLDLYVVNMGQENRLYHNTGNPPTVNVTAACDVGGSSGMSFNAAVGDVDGDGDLDILLNNYGHFMPANVQLFINPLGTMNNWARFEVVGVSPGNRHAIGANIDLRTGAQWQWREIYAGGNNFKSQNETVFHFGLGEATIIDEIVIKWPGGSPARTLTNYPVNKKWIIHPPGAMGDADHNGVINVADLLAVINAWGVVQPGSEICDVNGDGIINVADLLHLINNWG